MADDCTEHELACGAAYQLVGNLFDRFGIFDTKFAEAWLNYLSNPEKYDKPESYVPPENSFTSLVEERDKLAARLVAATEFSLWDNVKIVWRGNDRYAVKCLEEVLNKNGEWEPEPRPSDRDEEFIERARFSLDEAFKQARHVLTERG